MTELNSEFPETRASLLLRLQRGDDQQAWSDFVLVYRPIIYRLARKRGLQDADAQDLTQQVLVSISGAISQWEKQGEKTRFRHWCRRIARNAIINALTRRPQDGAVGGTSIQDLLLENGKCSPELTREIELEHRRELFFRAASHVRSEVAGDTWSVFQLAVIESIPIEEVAKRTNKTVGAAYAARGRVMNRLRFWVKEWEHES